MSTAPMTMLGEAPPALSAQTEKSTLWVEQPVASGNFEPVPFFGGRAIINTGANDAITTAEVTLSLGRSVLTHPDPPEEPLRDWQVLFDIPVPLNTFKVLLGGRRIQLRTARQSPQEDWVLFEGFIERVELGWSGMGQAKRWVELICVSTIVAADREPNQFLFGQWRRSRRAAMGLRNGEGGENWACRHECICVTAAPCVFNPGGQPNCHPTPLEFADGSRVFVFTDADDPFAEHWTTARMLRYVQWAALQPALQPYNYEHGYPVLLPRVSSSLGITEAQWTSFNLQHGISQCNHPDPKPYGSLNAIIDPYLAEPSSELQPVPPARDRLMQRALPDCAVQSMSIMEGFVYLADRFGMLCHVEHETGEQGEVLTALCFSIRGDRWDVYSGPPPGSPGPTARGVYLWVPSDMGDPGNWEAHEVFEKANATEGSLLIDESQSRTGIYVLGGPTEFEVSAMLKPGWQPDTWWDVDPDDPAAVAEALARLVAADPSPWATRYQRSKAEPLSAINYRNVGRYWVWNEDGGFAADNFQRTHGPWSSEAIWNPVKFWNDIGYAGLAERGDNGFSVRRRRFLPTRAEASPGAGIPAVPLALMVQVSFQSGANDTWWFDVVQVVVESDRCAIWIGDDDLRTIKDPGGSGETFASAYIKGLLRVRVFANVESDDAGFGFASPTNTAYLRQNWWQLVDRRQLQRRLRHRGPSQTTGAIANCPLGRPGAHPDGYGVTRKLNDDPVGEAEKLAERFRDELELRRFTGQVTIPWLWRDGHGPQLGYRIGDEVLGIKTGDQQTFVPMAGSNDPRWPASRIIGITYTISADPDEQSTTLRIEDRVYTPDDVIGSPDVGGAPSGAVLPGGSNA